MTPIYFTSPSNDQYIEHNFFSPSDHQTEHQFLSPKSQASTSSDSPTCHLFFNPITTTHDQDESFNRETHPTQNEDDNFGSQAYADHRVENKDEGAGSNGGLKFSLWKSENYDHMNDGNQVKWMSSKMRVMLKMKKTDPLKLNTLRSTTTELELEDHQDHKEPLSSPMEETTNSSSINSTSSNNNIQIRVCSDCNTTKTPLWRSGPRGPKSLCNACGIRQRKARKAMAAAAAEAAGETNKNVSSDKPTSLKATRVLPKDHKKTNIGHVTMYKKKQYSKQISTNLSPSSSPPTRKNCVEEFLVSLRKNLAIHGVFPQDEKEAAILLMALSCGYAHQ